MQTHEATFHRVDAELAAGLPISPIGSERPHTVDDSTGQLKCWPAPRGEQIGLEGRGSPLSEIPSADRLNLKVADTKEAIMADYATLLRDHVTLTCRSVDRIFLQAYIPKLQCVGGVCQFL